MADVAISFNIVSILNTRVFSWVFLVDCVMVIALVIFSLFYFNQLLGFVLSRTIGWILWARYGVSFKIQSIQFSLLGGRILFRNISYIGSSQSLHAIHGSLTWRYWLIRKRKSAFVSSDNGTENFPVALDLKMYGVEWFIYNREYAYDILVSKESPKAELVREVGMWQQNLTFIERTLVEILPLNLQVQKLGVIIGSADLEIIAVLSSTRVDCIVDMAPASSEADRYMNCIDANLQELSIELHDNPDYRINSINSEHQVSGINWAQKLRKKFKNEQDKPWFGLKRYLDEYIERDNASPQSPYHPKVFNEKVNPTVEDTNDMDTESFNQKQHIAEAMLSNRPAVPAEYAKVIQIFSCDTLKYQFRSDVAGPNKSKESTSSDSDNTKIQSDPIFDTKLDIVGGKINYGPYAERQRQAFFGVFFPRNCRTADPNNTDISGLRLHPHSTIDIVFIGGITIVIPVREQSKDSAFNTEFLQSFETAIQRNYGWIELRAGEGSKLNMKIPFIPEETGFYTKCDLILTNLNIRSSVNHDTMITAKQHYFKTVQHQPLQWNAEQTFTIENRSVDLKWFVLREQVTLISDTILDFSTKPPVAYELFIPAHYLMSWYIEGFTLFLNVNKENIINEPCSVASNTFLKFMAPTVSADWDIPMKAITSPVAEILTRLNVPIIDLELSAPNWHTLQGFLDSQRMAQVENVSITLRHYISTLNVKERKTGVQMETNTSRYIDTQVLDVTGARLAVTAHGFLIEYFLRIRENYFGHAYHFQTTEEFLKKAQKQRENGMLSTDSTMSEFKRSDMDNDMEIRIKVLSGCIILPSALYSSRNSISLNFVELNADLRFTNYYMDFQLEIAPVTGRFLSGLNPGTAFEEALRRSVKNVDLSISQLDIHAHRMFGLPPVEPTYVVRWDLNVGDITSDMKLPFLLAAQNAALVFGHSIKDYENRPVSVPEDLNDVTFVSCSIESIDMTVRAQSEECMHSRFQLSTSAIKFNINDLATERYSGRGSVEIPYLRLRAFSESENNMVLDVTTAIYITLYKHKAYWKSQKYKQQQHLALHDTLFHRAPFLMDSIVRNTYPYTRHAEASDICPCIPLSPFAPPLTRENVEFIYPYFAVDNCRQNPWNSSCHTSLDSLPGGTDSDDLFYSSNSEDEKNSWAERNSSIKSVRSLRPQYENPIPDIYPFSNNLFTNDRMKIKAQKADFNLKPTPWHPDAPGLIVAEGNTENLSVIIQFTPVKVKFTPEVLALVDAFESKREVDFDTQLDFLQIYIVEALLREQIPQKIFKCHLIIPSIDICFSDSIMSSHGISCEVSNLKLMCKILPEGLNGLRVNFDSLTYSLRNGNIAQNLSYIYAASIILSKLDFWWQKTSEKDSTGSFILSGVDASIATDQAEWAIEYSSLLLYSVVSQIKRKKFAVSKQDELKASFYALTMAGVMQGVEQDSYVLSKPSGVVHSQAHVRTQISWRLVMRLRYLLQRISPVKRTEMEAKIANGTFDLPIDVKNKVLDVYRKWRSWEQSDNLEETEVFKRVFEDLSFPEFVLSLSTKISVRIESMVARLVYPNMQDHYAGLDMLHIHLVSTQQSEIQNVNVTVRCSKARAKGSLKLLAVIETIMTAISKIAIPETLQNPSQMSTDEPLSAAATKYIHAFQTSISVFLLDLILEFDFETIHIETQNHQIQFTSAVELMTAKEIASLFHNGTLISTYGAFRVFQSRNLTNSYQKDVKDIFDSLVKDVHLGYASYGLKQKSNSWATLKINAVSFISHATADEFATLVLFFLEKDLPLIRGAVSRIMRLRNSRPSSAVSTGSDLSSVSFKDASENLCHIFTDVTSNNETIKNTGRYINIEISTIKFKTNLIDELRFNWLAKSLKLNLRGSFMVVGSFDIEKSTLGIHLGSVIGSVANMQFDAISAILTYDPAQMAISVSSDLSALTMETMSLVWILEYTKYQKIDDQISELLTKVEQITKVLNNSKTSGINKTSMFLHDQDETSNTAIEPNFQVRLSHKVKKIGLRLPLDSCSFELVIDELYCKFENSKSVSGGINDLKLLLVVIQKPSREVVRMKFDIDTLKKDEKYLFVVNSDYIRFVLDPETVGAMVIAYDKLKDHSRGVFNNEDSTNSLSKSELEIPSANSGSLSSFNISDLEKLRVKLLLQYMTVTWYTDSNSNIGIVIGYEKLHLRMVNLLLKIELAGSYVTPATQSFPNNEQNSVKDRVNTAYLPLLEVSVTLVKSTARLTNEKYCMSLFIRGKSIVLTLTPAIAPWVLALCDSYIQVVKTLGKINQCQIETASRINERTSNPKPQEQLELLFFNFVASAHFDCSILRLYSEELHGSEPALELFTPSIKIHVDFINNQLHLRIDASKTSNTVYPRAVSEIKAITSLVSIGLNRRKYNSPLNEPSFKSKEDTRSGESPEFNILRHIEIDFRLHFESQELYLSCLPSGKEGASMKTEGVDIVCLSPKTKEPHQSYYSIYGLVKHSQISLQHMYSREISALAEFSQFTALGMHCEPEPFRVALKLTDPLIKIELSKLHEMRNFMDIWAFFDSNMESHHHHPPKRAHNFTNLGLKYSAYSSNLGQKVFKDKRNNLGSSSENSDMAQLREYNTLLDKYKNAVSLVPFAVFINLNIVNLTASLGLGHCIGDAHIGIDRIWLAYLQTSSIEQILNAGISSVAARLNGRIGGMVDLNGLMVKAAVQWKNGRNSPLIHAKLKLDTIGFYFSLDFHPFIALNSKVFTAILTTQDKLDVQDDRIHITFSYDSISLAITALVAVHSYDAIALFKRLQSQICSSPTTPTEASNLGENFDFENNEVFSTDVPSSVETSGMRILFNIRLGVLLVTIFPTDYVDKVALRVYAKRVEIHYDRLHIPELYQTGIDIAADGTTIGLVNIKGSRYSRTVTDLDYVEFLSFVGNRSVGSTIINTPEIKILMDTWEYLNDLTEVHYKFSNEVHGSIDVGWNLGSINFIKDMLITHKKSWADRQEMYDSNNQNFDHRNQQPKADDENGGKDKNHAKLSLAISDPQSSAEVQPQPESDANSINTHEDKRVMELGGIRYVAREKPNIRIPQLRNLGDATPPIEWLGVNRDKIPLFIHANLMQNLAMGADELEKFYVKFLCKRD